MLKKRNLIIGIGMAILVILAGLVSNSLISNQNKMLKSQTLYQQKQLEQQAALLSISRNNNLMPLMTNLLDQAKDELASSATRTLSDATITRLAELSASFQPYPYWEKDRLSVKELSPERGQLFLSLMKMKIDSSSFAKIKTMVTFAKADLKKADLRKADLKGIDLSGADLSDANLEEVDLSRSELVETNFWASHMKKTRLIGSDLRWADLRWTNLDSADLEITDMNGANLASAKLRGANLAGARFQWGFLNGALLQDANLSGVDLWATDFSLANLTGANLSRAYLGFVTFDKTNLSNVNLTKTTFDEEDWLEQLSEWKVVGAAAIQKNYRKVDLVPGRDRFWLEKIEE